MITFCQAIFNGVEMAKKKEILFKSLSRDELNNELRRIFVNNIFEVGFFKVHLLEKLAEVEITDVSDEELRFSLDSVLSSNGKVFIHGARIRNDGEVVIKLNLQVY